MSNLLNIKCKPCSGNTPKMTINEIEKELLEINNWELNTNSEMIFKKFKFNNFKKALHFTNSIGKIAEEEGHHPDISLGWGYCLIMIHTHAIKGLSINDFILAAKIDQLINNQ
jgi:4a-hydroxytetrahydrobiopterin dehydratase